MTTVINTPRNDSGSGAIGIIVGVLVAAAIVILFFVFVLPEINTNRDDRAGSTTINVQLPSGSDSGN